MIGFIGLLQNVTTNNYDSRESFGSSKRARVVLNPVQWETVFPCDTIQFPVFHVETQVPVLLPDENGGDDQGLSHSLINVQRYTSSSISPHPHLLLGVSSSGVGG
jgi:hypothetical protein